MIAQTYYGLDIAWGLGSSAVTITGVTGIYQSTDHELKLDENEIRDQRGNVVAWVGYNPTETATLEYVATDASPASGSATITYPDRGTKISIAADGAISGSGWIVQSDVIKRTNTDACKVTLKCIRYLAIA
jgi:hypothetical protein